MIEPPRFFPRRLDKMKQKYGKQSVRNENVLPLDSVRAESFFGSKRKNMNKLFIASAHHSHTVQMEKISFNQFGASRHPLDYVCHNQWRCASASAFVIFFSSMVIALIPFARELPKKTGSKQQRVDVALSKNNGAAGGNAIDAFLLLSVLSSISEQMPGIRPVQANCIVCLYKSSRLISEL